LGAILCINMVVMVNMMYTNPNFKGNAPLGYAAMLVIFSLIFFGVRNYRNKELGGIITFKKAFVTGLMITLLASTMYVVLWLFYYYLFVPDFLDIYIPIALNNTSPENLAEKTVEMEQFKEMYKNPFFVIIVTYAEVFPIGLVVTLLSAFILKKRN